MAGKLQNKDHEDALCILRDMTEAKRKRREAMPFEIQVRLAKRDNRRLTQLLAASEAGDADEVIQLLGEHALGLDEDGHLEG